MRKKDIPNVVNDDFAFPIRIKLRIPPVGIAEGIRMLSDQCGLTLASGTWAVHPGLPLGADVIALYLARLSDAEQLLAALPQLELADEKIMR